MSRVLPIVAMAALLAACRSMPTGIHPTVVGADRDPHGCIGSAGYAWCARTDRCERPWELAAAVGIELAPAAVTNYCEAR